MPVLTHPPLTPRAQALINHGKGMDLVLTSAKSAGLPMPKHYAVDGFDVQMYFESLGDLSQWAQYAEAQIVDSVAASGARHHVVDCQLMDLPVHMVFVEQVRR